jgi:hypothetical protein
MKKIRSEDVRFDSSSHIDPFSRLFHYEGHICRAFFPDTADFYRQLIASPRMQELITSGRVVDTVVEEGTELEGFGLVARHRRISFPSYCF